MIEPDIDVYGGLARGSALADYLELLALSGKRCTRSQLEDAVKDRYWTRKRAHMVVDAGDLNEDGEYDEDGELQSHVEEAFECLYERSDVLKGRYPFVVSPSFIELDKGVETTSNVYIALLCLTAAHAYRLASVTELFEEIVAATLESRGLLVARVGQFSRSVAGGVTWPDTLRQIGDALNIPTVLEGAAWQRHANDMGADAIAHHSWSDRRVGRWTYVFQITCGDSESWRQKFGQAAPGLWTGWFQEQIDPLCGLAVPHHVPPRTFNLLVQDQRKMFLDRLRLVAARNSVSSGETALIETVLEVGIDNVAAA